MSGSLFLITTLIWGTTWIAIKYQIALVSAEVSLVYRFGAAAIIFFIWAWLKKCPLKLNLKDHQYLALLGILMFGLNYLLTYWAAKAIPSGLLATLFSLAPVVNIFFEFLFYKRPIQPRMLLGAVLGAAGIALIFLPELSQFQLSNQAVIGLMYCFAALISFSLANMITVRNQSVSLPGLTCNAYGMAYGTLFLALCAVAADKPFIFDHSFEYIVSLSYLTIFGSVISFACYLVLVGRVGPGRAAYITIFFPIVALLVSTVFEGFQWTGYNLVGVSLALSSSLFVIGKPKPKLQSTS